MVDLNGERGSKPVYVGKEKGEPIPANRIIGCFILISIFVLVAVCLAVVWTITR